MNEDLIILGNGFDLSCGLKSSYKDFYDSRITNKIADNLDEMKKKIDSFISVNPSDNSTLFLEHSSVESISLKCDGLTEAQFQSFKELTFWDLIFYYTKSDNEYWHNIENQIQDFLICNKEISLKSMNIDIKPTDSRMSAEVLPMYLCMLIANRAFDEDKYKGKDNEQFLLDELKRLEQNFVAYLSNEISQKKDVYDRNIEILLKKLVTKRCPENMLTLSDENAFNPCKILSFNYTNPGLLLQIFKNITLQNVHGSLSKKDIIFGIDQKDIEFSDYAYKYTKTYRQMISENHIQEKESILPNIGKLRSIKFFGHSLSEFDYSYFQAIFDYYDIYSSSVPLIFCFKKYDEKKTEDLRVELAESVTKMLKEYSKTLPNENHGKNLIHKLLLEERLIIKEVPS